jgi:hypothetical protein
MKQKPRVTEKKVKVLTNPDIRFMSFVDHGANQTPFAVVKRATTQGATEPQGETDMAIKRKETTAKGAADQKNVAVRSLTFSGTTFKTEADVTAWLDNHGWEGYSVTKGELDFVAAGADVSDEQFADLRGIDVAAGITAKVGKRVDGSEDTVAKEVETTEKTEESDDTVAKTDEPATKADDVQAPASFDFDALVTRLSDVGVAAPEATTARKGMYTVQEFGYILSELKYVYNYAESFGLSEEEATTLKSASQSLVSILASAMTKTVAEFEEAFKTAKAADPAGVDQSLPNKTDATIVNTDKDKKLDDAAQVLDLSHILLSVSDVVKEAIGAAVNPLKKQLDEVAANVENANKAATEAKETAEKAAKDATDLANRSPSKKAASEPLAQKTDTKASEAASTRKAEAVNMFRQNLGL